MSYIITIGTQKGGVGKTTTTVNTAGALAELGKKVLVIDADAQANTSKILLKQMELREARNVPDVLSDSNGGLFSAVACPTNHPNIMIVPNHIKCLLWEEQVRGSIDGILGFKRILHKDEALMDYDYIILDTPPNLGVMINNALMISNYVVIPVPIPDQFALDGFATFISHIGKIRNQNPALSLLGVLLTKYDARATTYKNNRVIIENTFKSQRIPMFESVIRTNVDIDRAHQKRKTIFELDKKKPGAEDYLAFAQEVIRMCDGQKEA
jgi:chromosome partitioning protein